MSRGLVTDARTERGLHSEGQGCCSLIGRPQPVAPALPEPRVGCPHPTLLPGTALSPSTGSQGVSVCTIAVCRP